MPAVPYRDDPTGPDDAQRRPYAVRERPATDHAPTPRRPSTNRPAAPPAFEGLTSTGAGAIGLVGAGSVAVIDAWISPGLGLLFAFGFVLTSAFVGLRLRGRDSWAALAVPPLVYISAAGLGAQVGALTAGSWVERTSSDMATAVIGQWAVLCIGTLVAVGAVGYRAALARSR